MVHLSPFRLRYRSLASLSIPSSRRTPGSTGGVVLSFTRCGYLSARGRAGSSPRRASHFLCLPKESNPRKGPPFAGRPRADCSALLVLWGTRRTRFVRIAHCAQTGVAKSVHEARCACCPKALRCSTALKGPRQSNARRLLRKHPLSSALAQPSLGGDAKRAVSIPVGGVEERRV